jgi:hypothetical protein
MMVRYAPHVVSWFAYLNIVPHASSALNLCEPEYPATGPHSEFAMKSYIQVHGVGHALACVAHSELQPPRLPRLQYIASLPRMFSPCSSYLMEPSHHCRPPRHHIVDGPS